MVLVVYKMQRREFVLSTGAAAAVGLTGCIHGDDDPNGDDDDDDVDENGLDFPLVDDEPDYQGYFDDTPSYQDIGGTVDWTGEEEVEVSVGHDDYQNQYVPPAIHVDAGTTVEWNWETVGHDIQRSIETGGPAADRAEGVDTGGEWDGEGQIENPPHSYSHTFEEGGIYLYVCTPHDASDRMYGAVVVEEAEDANGEENGEEENGADDGEAEPTGENGENGDDYEGNETEADDYEDENGEEDDGDDEPEE